jgi:3-hydroxymyristoyl/3-hydroxydecanoyl-(acyl carrier protein) dehydratase
MAHIRFDGVEFNAVPVRPSKSVERGTAPATRGTTRELMVADRTVTATSMAPLAAVRDSVVRAHQATIAAAAAVARATLQGGLTPALDVQAMTADRDAVDAFSKTRAAELAAIRCFRPLARPPKHDLSAEDLDVLARGGIEQVFGVTHRQTATDPTSGRARTANQHLRIGGHGQVRRIESLDSSAGGSDFGGLTTWFDGDPVAAARTAAEVFGAYVGLHLCLADCSAESKVDGVARDAPSTQRLSLRVVEMDLVPIPHLRARVSLDGLDPSPANSFDVTVRFVPRGDVALGPGTDGHLQEWTGRVAATGEQALLSEFHMAHLARGDQGIAFGPEFARFTGNRATRLPTGGLLLVDRVTEFSGKRGSWDAGADYRTEYDVPVDAWYLDDTANGSVPHFVYMETSLQAALLMGYYLGPTLGSAETLRLRNLGGTATVHHRLDLRGKTIDQTSKLVSTTLMPGSSLQSFEYSLSADGREFYSGSTMFGYFSDSALDNQTGLDAGRLRPNWLKTLDCAPDIRTIDVAKRRSRHGALCSTGALALIDHVDVVDGGGQYGKGYLHMTRDIEPDEWFFDCHFYLDPVIPGSLGVESVIQCIQEWMVDSGMHRRWRAPQFHIPENVPFNWKYRGQFVPEDSHCELEIHVKDVRSQSDSVVVVADASLWKPGLRIYELIDISVELREGI